MLNTNEELIFEGFNAIKAAICGIESGVTGRQVIRVLFSRKRLSKKQYELSWLNVRAKKLGFEVVLCDEDDVVSVCSTDTHGGIVGIFSNRSPLAIDDLIKADIKLQGWYLSLEGIEDPYNLGFSIRSAYAFGCVGVILPNRYIFGADGVVCRSSAGASERIPFFRCELADAFKTLKEKGYSIIAACEKNSVSLTNAKLKLPAVLVVGGEKRGISASVLSECTDFVKIDYARYAGSSLSAVSAAAVMSYAIAEKNGLLTSEK